MIVLSVGREAGPSRRPLWQKFMSEQTLFIIPLKSWAGESGPFRDAVPANCRVDLGFHFCRRFLDLLLQEKYFTLFTAPAGIINLKLNKIM